MRLAEPFEALRDKADVYAKAHDHAPYAFLATLGSLAEFNARASFASNRLAVCGVETGIAGEYADLGDCVDAFCETGARLAVICGADNACLDRARELAARLRRAGAMEVWLAGRSCDLPGIDHCIHPRSDSLEDGARAHAVLGIRP